MSAPLPKGWTETTLGDLIEPRRTKADPQATPTASFVGLEHVEAHTTKLLGTTSATAMKSSANAFKRGDVLYGRLRPYLNKVCQPDFDGLCSGEFVVMPENHAVSGAFLKFRLSAYDFVDFASHLNSGDRPRVDFGQLRSFTFALPPISEQSRIADTLAHLLNETDAGTATLQRCQEKLTDYRAAVLNAAVKGDLTADWRKRNPGVEHWRRVAFDQIATIQGGLQKSPARAPKQHHYPYLRVANVHRGRLHLDELRRFELTPEELRKLRLEPGDVLLVEGNGSRKEIGRCALWNGEVENCVHQNHIIRARLEEGVLPQYVSIFLNSPTGQLAIQQAANSTSGLYTLSVKKVKALSIALPPVAEQREIVDAVASHVSAVDAISKDLTEKLSQANSLRQSLLHRAFTGNLAPQNANDEPAAKLLERIARERKARRR